MILRVQMFVDRVIAGIWVRLPLWMLVSSRRIKLKMPIVVALTSYPARIGATHLTLRSILAQSQTASAVVLVVSKVEFSSMDALPARLVRLVRAASGQIRVIFTEDNKKSYKKLLPILELYPSSIIVTADDDVIYTRTWLGDLVRASETFPNSIVGTRGSTIEASHRSAAPYVSWKASEPDRPDHSVFLTGRGGILYPPDSLDPRVHDWPLALRLSPSADDIWFKVMAILAGTPCVAIDTGRDYPASGASQRFALYTQNIGQNENDLAFNRLFNHFDLWAQVSAPVRKRSCRPPIGGVHGARN